jgi:hypothetical protein
MHQPNWKIVKDGECSTIMRTDEAPDSFEVFYTFQKAKSALLSDLRARTKGLKMCADRIKQMNEHEVENESGVISED